MFRSKTFFHVSEGTGKHDGNWKLCIVDRFVWPVIIFSSHRYFLFRVIWTKWLTTARWMWVICAEVAFTGRSDVFVMQIFCTRLAFFVSEFDVTLNCSWCALQSSFKTASHRFRLVCHYKNVNYVFPFWIPSILFH